MQSYPDSALFAFQLRTAMCECFTPTHRRFALASAFGFIITKRLAISLATMRCGGPRFGGRGDNVLSIERCPYMESQDT